MTALSCAGYSPAKIHLILLWFRFVIDNPPDDNDDNDDDDDDDDGDDGRPGTVACPQRRGWIQPGTQGQNMDLLGSCEVPTRHLFGWAHARMTRRIEV